MTMEVAAVVRALAILDAFNATENTLTLGELARRTRLHKTTAHERLFSILDGAHESNSSLALNQGRTTATH